MVKLEPTDVQAIITQARVVQQQGDWEKAQKVILEGIKSVPDSEELQAFAGDSFRGRGEYEKAELAYKAALSVAKKKSSSLLRLGGLYALQRMKDEADLKFVEAVKAAETPMEKLNAHRSRGQFLASIDKTTEA